MELCWQWYTFEEFSGEQLYAILALRQQVFVVEQQCAYLDCDGLDQGALHLVGWQKAEELSKPLAYLRVIIAKKEREMPVIGRLLTHQEIRGKGIGERLLVLGLQKIQTSYPGSYFYDMPTKRTVPKVSSDAYPSLSVTISLNFLTCPGEGISPDSASIAACRSPTKLK